MSDPLASVKDLRKRVVAGEDVPDEELKEAIALLHKFRNNVEPKTTTASKAKATKTAAAKKADIDLSDLLG